MTARLDRAEALLEKLAESQARTDAQLDKRAAELDKFIKESQAKTDAQMSKTFAGIREAQAKTDAKIAELADEVKKVTKLVGNVTNTDGSIAEQKMYYALKKHLKIGNMQFDEIKRDLRPDGENGPQFDILLINGDSVCVVEVKKSAHVNDLDILIEKTISNFKKHCTAYADYKTYFALASVNIYPDLIKKSAERGIFLLTEQNDVMEILNDKAVTF